MSINFILLKIILNKPKIIVPLLAQIHSYTNGQP